MSNKRKLGLVDCFPETADLREIIDYKRSYRNAVSAKRMKLVDASPCTENVLMVDVQQHDKTNADTDSGDEDVIELHENSENWESEEIETTNKQNINSNSDSSDSSDEDEINVTIGPIKTPTIPAADNMLQVVDANNEEDEIAKIMKLTCDDSNTMAWSMAHDVCTLQKNLEAALKPMLSNKNEMPIGLQIRRTSGALSWLYTPSVVEDSILFRNIQERQVSWRFNDENTTKLRQDWISAINDKLDCNLFYGKRMRQVSILNVCYQKTNFMPKKLPFDVQGVIGFSVTVIDVSSKVMKVVDYASTYVDKNTSGRAHNDLQSLLKLPNNEKLLIHCGSQSSLNQFYKSNLYPWSRDVWNCRDRLENMIGYYKLNTIPKMELVCIDADIHGVFCVGCNTASMLMNLGQSKTLANRKQTRPSEAVGSRVISTHLPKPTIFV